MALPAVATGGGSRLPTESGCVPEYDQTLAPASFNSRTGVLLLGETVTATLRAKAICTAWPVYRHIVFTLDLTPSLSSTARRRVLDTAREAVSRYLPAWGNIWLGMVAYNGRGLATCELSNDAVALKRCVARLDSPRSSGGDVAARDLGLSEARAMLLRARDQRTGLFQLHEDVVVISDGALADRAAAMNASRDVQGQEGYVLTACASPLCDTKLLSDVSINHRNSLSWKTLPNGLLDSLTWLHGDLIKFNIRDVIITGTLPDDVTYLPDGTSPPPDDRSADGRTLSWRFKYVPKDGVTVTLSLRPERSGDQQPILSATGALTDSQRLSKAWSFPDLRAVVLGARP